MRDLEQRWKCYTMDAVEAEIMDSKERARMKRMANDHDRSVSTMGRDA